MLLLFAILGCRGLTVNDVTSGTSPDYPELKSLYVDAPPQLAYERAMAVASTMPGWSGCEDDPDVLNKLHCEATTPTMGFVDDVWIRVGQYGPTISRVEMRSASRTGKGDMGANAERILAFQAAYMAYEPPED
ncbi:MAG: DUF1499 domain-containing protein [Proteobacteria bacterium]|nr:DUF1499 domain-containing protein [Pseudomonadota bacterium]MCP4916712.1 DUF1499 domain-containing protein [Pseudomonadota bacterium]